MSLEKRKKGRRKRILTTPRMLEKGFFFRTSPKPNGEMRLAGVEREKFHVSNPAQLEATKQNRPTPKPSATNQPKYIKPHHTIHTNIPRSLQKKKKSPPSNLPPRKRRHPSQHKIKPNHHTAHDPETRRVIRSVEPEQDRENHTAEVSQGAHRAAYDAVGVRVYVRDQGEVGSVLLMSAGEGEGFSFLERGWK